MVRTYRSEKYPNEYYIDIVGNNIQVKDERGRTEYVQPNGIHEEALKNAIERGILLMERRKAAEKQAYSVIDEICNVEPDFYWEETTLLGDEEPTFRKIQIPERGVV